eukprot:CAMPEP_0168234572 /NCGR_PEP_ID=MMETSP0140_2-20121125/18336_1 /TAXON_ID=44445 /ORGANISM="Pseudo-nitzschia australis, Strain 10249 10 AB" /LENGTH=761 /DNA_ID=CAMNT_0008167371 /DNA_START=88 /DNA_END=2370 /DNA_ORIENTATION=-
MIVQDGYIDAVSGQRSKSLKRATSYPGLSMLTRIAAGGKASNVVIVSPHDGRPISLRQSVDENEQSLKSKINRLTITLVVFIVILIGQSTVSITLKHNGFIDRDLHDIISERVSPVAERVIPELQQRLELIESRMIDTLEMAKFMAPNFNETVFWRRMNSSSLNPEETVMTATTHENMRPGFQLAQKHGAKGKYPVVMVPGFTTSGLEVWKGKSCMQNFFRERVWGGLSSAQYWLRERYCIMENLALNPSTGGDPEGIKLRSSQGFGAADFFVGNDWMWGNYWVWSKILENLADVDYDVNTMTMEAYDWRLGIKMLEDRDHYFTHLKKKIEGYHKSSGKKVILTSHSMGAIVVHYFFAWVTENKKRGGGGGGRKWVDEHIHAYVNIAGSQLGAPKAVSSLMSGETRDTIFMGGIGSVVEHFIPRKARRDLWTTWGSIWSMIPKGGDALWSIGADFPQTQSCDDTDTCAWHQDDIKKNLIVLSPDSVDDGTSNDPIHCNRNDLLDQESESTVNHALQQFASGIGHTTQNVIDFLLTWGAGLGPTASPAKLYSFAQNPREDPSTRTWHDITQTPLPYAPKMKIYCLYGVGVDTERVYFYKRNPGEQGLFSHDNSSDDGKDSTQKVADPPFILDTSIEDPSKNIVHGIRYVDGDGTVPLLSLGYMCAGPWRDEKSRMNPSGSKVITREYNHRTEFFADDPLRKGPHSSEHVDILGNHGMMEDFMKIVSDEDLDSVKDNFISDIQGIVKRIKDHPDGGLQRPKRW